MTDDAVKRLRVDIEKPKFDMNSYIGRAKHFFLLTNPLNILVSDERLQRAREVVTAYRKGIEVPYVNTIEEVWREKYLYDSAYHPETGEKMFILGRMSAQMPLNTFLSTCMVAFYKNRYQVIFFQWLNQTANAVVNYTNRSGRKSPSMTELLLPYMAATFGALGTALTLGYVTRSMPKIIRRLVPFGSVAAGNSVNIPMMRQNEIIEGVMLLDRTECAVGFSRKAALIGISQVVFSRIFMAIPSMVFPPIVVEQIGKNGFFRRHPKWNVPIQGVLVGLMLIFSTPLGCAFFRQKNSILVENLELEIREKIRNRCPNLREVFYNKGL